MKRLLIHSLIFSPDGVSTAYLYNDIALAFQNKGYDVIVVSTTPHFNIVPGQVDKQPMRWGFPGLFKISCFHGIKVYHVPQKKFKSTILRILGFVYWHLVSFFLVLCIKKIDVILSPSPPLTIGQLNLWLGKLKKCRVVYNVQEIYPDILGKDSGLVFSVLSKMERRIYAKSDAVTTIDQVFHDTIVGRFKDQSRLHIIPNFVDTELYVPDIGHSGLNKDLFPETDSIRVLYAGNIGFAQDWEPLVELARIMLGKPIDFFVIGEGVRKSYLEESKLSLELDNLHILPYQSRDLMPQILDYSDLQFIFMQPEMDMQGFPSKVYTVMACGRPLLVCSGEETPIVNFLSGTGCAKLITNRDFAAKVEQMAEWLMSISRNELRGMGRHGLEIIRKYYSKEVVTGQYVELIDSLL